MAPYLLQWKAIKIAKGSRPRAPGQADEAGKPGPRAKRSLQSGKL